MFESAMIAMPEAPIARPAADHARLERMFATYHATVWRILRRRGLSGDAAADATQEAFTIAVERLHEIQPDDERAFLIRNALQVARKLGRKAMRWQLEDDMDQRGLEERATDQRRADIQLCDLALAKVDPDLAEVFVLFELRGAVVPGDRLAVGDTARYGGIAAAPRARGISQRVCTPRTNHAS